MKCPSCGKELPYGTKFCQYCGIRVATDFKAPEQPEVVDLADSLAGGTGTNALAKPRKTWKERGLFIPFTALFCALAILIGVLGYRMSASPSRTAGQYLQAIQKQDWTKAEQLTSKNAEDMSLPAMADELRSAMQSTDESWNFYRKFMTKLCDFTYDIAETETNGDHATVTVKLSTYDFGAFSTSAISELYDYMMLSMFSVFGSGADYDDADIMKTLGKALDKVGTKRVSGTVKIPVVKEDGKWKIGTLDFGVMDVITGGLLSGFMNAELAEGEDSVLSGLDGFDFGGALDGIDFSDALESSAA